MGVVLPVTRGTRYDQTKTWLSLVTMDPAQHAPSALKALWEGTYQPLVEFRPGEVEM